MGAFNVSRPDGHESHQYTLPQQQQHLLHWEVRSVAAAELGNHTEEHDRDGLVVEQRRAWIKDGERKLFT